VGGGGGGAARAGGVSQNIADVLLEGWVWGGGHRERVSKYERLRRRSEGNSVRQQRRDASGLFPSDRLTWAGAKMWVQ
jgi:hypothetical protein